MAEETEKKSEEEKKPAEAPVPEKKEPVKAAVPKKKGGWFQKIPAEILLSPGGMILIFFALIIEIVDWIPGLGIDLIWEVPLDISFMILLSIIAKIPLKSLIIPFVIECIPIVNDIVPTWVIRMFM